MLWARKRVGYVGSIRRVAARQGGGGAFYADGVAVVMWCGFALVRGPPAPSAAKSWFSNENAVIPSIFGPLTRAIGARDFIVNV